jgi:hypothetical protein
MKETMMETGTGNPSSLAERVRQILETTPEAQLPLTYQQLATALGLRPPGTIQRVAMALEALMREDAREGRAFVAALVVSRRGEGVPAAGFFELAVELGRFPARLNERDAAYRREFHEALRQHG